MMNQSTLNVTDQGVEARGTLSRIAEAPCSGTEGHPSSAPVSARERLLAAAGRGLPQCSRKPPCSEKQPRWPSSSSLRRNGSRSTARGDPHTVIASSGPVQLQQPGASCCSLQREAEVVKHSQPLPRPLARASGLFAKQRTTLLLLLLATSY